MESICHTCRDQGEPWSGTAIHITLSSVFPVTRGTNKLACSVHKMHCKKLISHTEIGVMGQMRSPIKPTPRSLHRDVREVEWKS